MRGVIQTCLTVSGQCVHMRGVVGGGFVVVCACNSINVTQYTSAQSFLFLSKATCFD